LEFTFTRAFAKGHSKRVRICVIFNPTAKGDKARNFRKQLGEFGDAEMRATTHAGAAREMAKAAVEEGFETIVAAGGDGTLHEVVNGIGDAANGCERCKFGVIPLGTVNVFALELGIPFKLREAWQIVRAGKERRIDLPEATFRVGEETRVRRFLQMAGAGWDARAVELVSWKLKKRIGRFAYVWAGLGALNPPKAPVVVRGGKDSETGDFILVGNGKFYAGKFPFLYKADLSDGHLDVTVFPKFQWASLAGNVMNFVFGRYFRPGCQPYFHATTLDITSDAVTPLQLDGELVGHLPARVTVLPKALRVIVP
jgi:YegS/Rv2252/BmrU family lipid kinase